MENSHIENQILELLRVRPGLTAREIAAALGIEKTAVNSILYGKLQQLLIQNKPYRWWLRNAYSEQPPAEALPTTDLARLCRYYLECLASDIDLKASVWATSFGDPEYAEADIFPFLLEGDRASLAQAPGVGRVLAKVGRNPNQLQSMLGYPVFLRQLETRDGRVSHKVEPLFLFPLRIDGAGNMSIDELGPHVNFAALEPLAGLKGSDLLQAAAQLQEDLGLSGGFAHLPEPEDLAARLMYIHKDWPWVESLNPSALGSNPPLARADKPGIYNRAVVLPCQRSQYTVGLESELASLARLSEERLEGTALGAWIRGNVSAGADANLGTMSDLPLLEVVPLNTEQREAVRRALSQPVTVITGPPGTGKSQVVTSILVNAAWRGLKVLFASKNRKAVDVVRERVNGLGSRPVLMSLHRDDQEQLRTYLAALLGAATTKDDVREFEDRRRALEAAERGHADVSVLVQEMVRFRNTVDDLEQAAEHARKALDVVDVMRFSNFNPALASSSLADLKRSLPRADRHRQPWPLRALWPLIRQSRTDRVGSAMARLSEIVAPLHLPCPDEETSTDTIAGWAEEIARRLPLAGSIAEYVSALAQLTAGRSLEKLYSEQSMLTTELAETSLATWQAWLRTLAGRMTRGERQLLGEYVTLLQMGLSRQARERIERLFPDVVKFLSSWSITSLSARNLPLEPSFFDLVVIDEASQCDIASAVPLLFRARRSVIIGDPQQLRHITQVTPAQDMILQQKHDVSEKFATWSYSANSLYDLASRGMVGAEAIVALQDHFRSHSDVIGFSNRRFYADNLRVATRHNHLKGAWSAPAIRWIDVKGSVVRPHQGGALNIPEAQAVGAELRRLLVEQAYQGSVGVVTPFHAQVDRIRDILRADSRLASASQRADLLTDSIHGFQGDERDIMVFSPVFAKGIAEGAVRFLKNNGNLFNVAITRARAGLVVVGDMEAARNSGIEYLADFVGYVESLAAPRSTADGKSPPDEGGRYPAVATKATISEWEVKLYSALYGSGLRPFVQYSVPPYLIDLVLINGTRKLAIEVDGERYRRAWHGDYARRDQIKNLRLIELGWDVMRIWVYQVRDDLSGCVNRVHAWASAPA